MRRLSVVGPVAAAAFAVAPAAGADQISGMMPNVGCDDGRPPIATPPTSPSRRRR